MSIHAVSSTNHVPTALPRRQLSKRMSINILCSTVNVPKTLSTCVLSRWMSTHWRSHCVSSDAISDPIMSSTLCITNMSIRMSPYKCTDTIVVSKTLPHSELSIRLPSYNNDTNKCNNFVSEGMCWCLVSARLFFCSCSTIPDNINHAGTTIRWISSKTIRWMPKSMSSSLSTWLYSHAINFCCHTSCSSTRTNVPSALPKFIVSSWLSNNNCKSAYTMSATLPGPVLSIRLPYYPATRSNPTDVSSAMPRTNVSYWMSCHFH